jgi:hypothetical protein
LSRRLSVATQSFILSGRYHSVRVVASLMRRQVAFTKQEEWQVDGSSETFGALLGFARPPTARLLAKVDLAVSIPCVNCQALSRRRPGQGHLDSSYGLIGTKFEFAHITADTVDETVKDSPLFLNCFACVIGRWDLARFAYCKGRHLLLQICLSSAQQYSICCHGSRGHDLWRGWAGSENRPRMT